MFDFGFKKVSLFPLCETFCVMVVVCFFKVFIVWQPELECPVVVSESWFGLILRNDICIPPSFLPFFLSFFLSFLSLSCSFSSINLYFSPSHPSLQSCSCIVRTDSRQIVKCFFYLLCVCYASWCSFMSSVCPWEELHMWMDCSLSLSLFLPFPPSFMCSRVFQCGLALLSCIPLDLSLFLSFPLLSLCMACIWLGGLPKCFFYFYWSICCIWCLLIGWFGSPLVMWCALGWLCVICVWSLQVMTF